MTSAVPAHDMSATVERLRAAGCVWAEEEAEIITAAAADPAELESIVARRVTGEPLEQVVGFADFCGVRVRVRPGVFVPRARSALLVRAAVAEARRCGGHVVILDLCCGSGGLGLATRAALGGTGTPATLVASDIDPAAVACARVNLGDGVYHGDLFAGLPARLRGRVDVLLANVPYVASRHLGLLPSEARDYEPRSALDGGEDGLDVFRAVVGQADDWLAARGALLSEITEAQTAAATAAARAAGFAAEIISDDDLDARVVLVKRR
ncbi:putative protein N(5)-glutamine methyltransferase [Mangrovihabitans endophyticus]|uniref:N5-glutamine S-adenosyl-L-methionine-dependent methyltransferase n=1 Tax=Mangrovihabitans endophyticus TaxID=1751298 RepID=A0A8J3C3U7_9ACTN|nr:putative protein N(5)-glutamine methyltransferase [Mangrovihabitans endophyticus]GGL14780.1 N5-glutamine S-adenosyl-L-methionine-dependent methyltransferase [Mangrovihabitans endophyticus]